MLARSFLTPAELNISARQFDALVKVLGMLERGELLWHKEDKIRGGYKFDMDNWPETHCGSVGCIGYWAEKVGKVKFRTGYYQSSEISLNIDNLFFNTRACEGNIKPEQAAAALRNFLATGKANWTAALKG